jgi:hypothetical protein
LHAALLLDPRRPKGLAHKVMGAEMPIAFAFDSGALLAKDGTSYKYHW